MMIWQNLAVLSAAISMRIPHRALLWNRSGGCGCFLQRFGSVCCSRNQIQYTYHERRLSALFHDCVVHSSQAIGIMSSQARPCTELMHNCDYPVYSVDSIAHTLFLLPSCARRAVPPICRGPRRSMPQAWWLPLVLWKRIVMPRIRSPSR